MSVAWMIFTFPSPSRPSAHQRSSRRETFEVCTWTRPAVGWMASALGGSWKAMGVEPSRRMSLSPSDQTEMCCTWSVRWMCGADGLEAIQAGAVGMVEAVALAAGDDGVLRADLAEDLQAVGVLRSVVGRLVDLTLDAVVMVGDLVLHLVRHVAVEEEVVHAVAQADHHGGGVEVHARHAAAVLVRRILAPGLPGTGEIARVLRAGPEDLGRHVAPAELRVGIHVLVGDAQGRRSASPASCNGPRCPAIRRGSSSPARRRGGGRSRRSGRHEDG